MLTQSDDSGLFTFFDPANLELLVKVLDPAAELLEDPFVEAVLGPRVLDVNRFSLEEGQLAVPDGRANSPGDRYAHSLRGRLV